MGRIFETRKVKMFARWAKTARAFTKVGKEIAIAVKLGGSDPDGNPRLRAAIQTGRSLNMPKDRIESAIQRAASKDTASYDEITYEGHAPYGIGIFVEAATDNPTRTVANVRAAFTHNGGSLGTNGCLSFLFDRKGVITIEPPQGDLSELELELIDHGLEEIFETEEGIVLYSSFTDYISMQRFLESKKITIKNAASQRIAKALTPITSSQEAEVMKLIEALEEDDDVQHVYHNMQVAG